MSLTDLILDESGDLILAQHESGEFDIAVATGAETVLQSIMIRLKIAKGSIWYNRAAGIDHVGLFFRNSVNRFNERLLPIARAIYRRAILDLRGYGVEGFVKERVNGELVEKDIEFEVDERSRTIKPIIPCILIDCENSISRGLIDAEVSITESAGLLQ